MSYWCHDRTQFDHFLDHFEGVGVLIGPMFWLQVIWSLAPIVLMQKNGSNRFMLARGFGESRFFRKWKVAVDLIYLYGYRINLEKELALYLYVLYTLWKSYMVQSKYMTIMKITQPYTSFIFSKTIFSH